MQTPQHISLPDSIQALVRYEKTIGDMDATWKDIGNAHQEGAVLPYLREQVQALQDQCLEASKAVHTDIEAIRRIYEARLVLVKPASTGWFSFRRKPSDDLAYQKELKSIRKERDGLLKKYHELKFVINQRVLALDTASKWFSGRRRQPPTFFEEEVPKAPVRTPKGLVSKDEIPTTTPQPEITMHIEGIEVASLTDVEEEDTWWDWQKPGTVTIVSYGMCSVCATPFSTGDTQCRHCKAPIEVEG